MKTSLFLNCVKTEDAYLLHNTLYPNIIKVNDEKLFPVVEKIVGNSEYYNLFFGDDDCDRFYNDLIKHKIIVPDETDEISLVNYYYRQYISGRPLQVILFPTRNCNFRCPYCYEQHEEKSLSEEHYDKIISFILDEVKIKKYTAVYVSWFGGEPMLQYQKIVEFMKRLRKVLPSYVILKGQMTTNAYLLTRERLEVLVDSGIDSYQVTIDGFKDTHDLTRKLMGNKPTWDTIMDNMVAAKESNLSFSIVLRTNVTNEMMSTIENWIAYLVDIFGDDKRFHYHFETVKNLGGDDQTFTFLEGHGATITDLSSMAKKYGIAANTFKKFLYPFSMVCYAANPHSIVVDVDGSLMKCTVAIDEKRNKIGHLDNGINDECHAVWTDFELNDNCKKCSLLPLCYGRKCPNSYFDSKVCQTVKQYYLMALKSM